MNTLEFANELSQEEIDLTLGRWTDRFQEFVAMQTLYLGGHIDRIPDSLKSKYWDTLLATLEIIPSDLEIKVTAELYDHLKANAPTSMSRIVEERVSLLNVS